MKLRRESPGISIAGKSRLGQEGSETQREKILISLFNEQNNLYGDWVYVVVMIHINNPHCA